MKHGDIKQFIERTIKKAGDAALELYGEVGVKYTKANAADVVTEADLRSEKIILDAIKREFPDHGIISEESGEDNAGAESLWIVDPLDGTRNFATKTPFWGVMMALVEKGETRYGAIYIPMWKDYLYAEKDKGAYRNGERTHCSDARDLSKSFGYFDVSSRQLKVDILSRFTKIPQESAIWMTSLNCMIVPTLLIVAGSRDWIITTPVEKKIWDHAASKLLIAESGCVVTRYNGKPCDYTDVHYIGANKYLHPQPVIILQGL